MRHPVLAANIRSARDELGRRRGRRVPQQEVADAVGLHVRVYQRHERGEIDIMLSTLLRIAHALETTAEALMRGVSLASSDQGDLR